MAPTLEAAIHAKLTGDNSVALYVAKRVYMNRLPQGSAYPAIRFVRIATPRLRTLQGPAGRAFPRFQIDLYARSEFEVLGLAAAVRGALDGFMGMITVGAGTNPPKFTLDGASAVNESSEFAEDSPDGGMHLQRLDFILDHPE